MLVPWLAVFDLRLLLARFKEPLDLDDVEARSDDFAILVPIFNDISYLKNVDFLAYYPGQVVLCTTSEETEAFYEALEWISREFDFRTAVVDVAGQEESTKNPWAILSKSVVGHDAVLRGAVSGLDERFVVFLDGDTTIEGDLSVACGAMLEEDYELASVRVLPSRRKTVIERLQGIEYDIAMDGRRVYPWLTSGAGMIARTDAMSHILQNHSLFFNGGDIEIGKLANKMGKRVGHVPIVFLTELPPTVGKWIRQRVSWMCGAFRHSVINVDNLLRYPGHFLYYFFLLYVLLPFKWFEILSAWQVLPVVYALYVLLGYATRWNSRSWMFFLFPLYALFQAAIIIWLGALRYIKYARLTGNPGRIRVRRHRKRHKEVISSHRRRIATGYAVNALLLIGVAILLRFGIGHLPI